MIFLRLILSSRWQHKDQDVYGFDGQPRPSLRIMTLNDAFSNHSNKASLASLFSTRCVSSTVDLRGTYIANTKARMSLSGAGRLSQDSWNVLRPEYFRHRSHLPSS